MWGRRPGRPAAASGACDRRLRPTECLVAQAFSVICEMKVLGAKQRLSPPAREASTQVTGHDVRNYYPAGGSQLDVPTDAAE